MRVQRSIRIRPEVDEALRVLAAEQHTSVSWLIERACATAYLDTPGSLLTDGRESASAKGAGELEAIKR
jgi:predicted transcriptional regulator